MNKHNTAVTKRLLLRWFKHKTVHYWRGIYYRGTFFRLYLINVYKQKTFFMQKKVQKSFGIFRKPVLQPNSLYRDPPFANVRWILGFSVPSIHLCKSTTNRKVLAQFCPPTVASRPESTDAHKIIWNITKNWDGELRCISVEGRSESGRYCSKSIVSLARRKYIRKLKTLRSKPVGWRIEFDTGPCVVLFRQ